MAFNLYFAGWGSKDADRYLRDNKSLRLLSQINEARLIESWDSENLSDRLFIDSGAYTAAHQGVPISIDSYIDKINSHPNIKIWAELDVIPFPVLNEHTAKECSEQSWNNYLYMREKVTTDCNILPVFHFGEPKSSLLRMLNTKINNNYVEYIGVGGRHGVSTDAQIMYFRDIWKIIKESDNPNVKVHVFGVTVPKILEKFPFYSADSTTWLQVAINGSILSEDLGSIVISDSQTKSSSHIKAMPKAAYDNLSEIVNSKGYNLDELASDYLLRLRYNIDVMRDWAQKYVLKEDNIYEVVKLF